MKKTIFKCFFRYLVVNIIVSILGITAGLITKNMIIPIIVISTGLAFFCDLKRGIFKGKGNERN